MYTAFLDANVLFSAAYKPKNRLLKLWSLENVTLITSFYALDEANRNLVKADQKTMLESLMRDVRIVMAVLPNLRLPPSITLPEKDIPIISAAILAKADVLVTGDIEHFEPYFGKKIKGVLILRPSPFIDFVEKSRKDSA